MVSIIICSRRAGISDALKENIESTIGSSHEIIVIDNSQHYYSIFSAYNEGVCKSHGDILCFMHEDILFHTIDWGQIAVNVFEDSSIGMLGFAGTHFLPSTPMYWFSSPFISEHNLTSDKGKCQECFQDDFYNESGLADVVAVDGFCFFIRKTLFECIRFDDVTFSGFHAYDMDICMQVLERGSRVCVCNRILIEHFWSEDSLSAKDAANVFNKNLELFSSKWKDSLPLHRGISLPEQSWRRIEALYFKVDEASKVRHSFYYRFGRFFLSPLRKLYYLVK